MNQKTRRNYLKIIGIFSLFLLFSTSFFFLQGQGKSNLLNKPTTPSDSEEISVASSGTAGLETSADFLKPEEIPNLTLESIFEGSKNQKSLVDLENLDPEKLVTLTATGDVIPARSVNYKMASYNNFKYPFEKTADFLKEADLTFVNLEAPLTKNCPVTREGMVFCGSQRFVEGLTGAGVDIVSLANNHSGNYGKEGLEQTIQLLTENHLDYTGLDNILIKEIKGQRFAFLGFNGVGPSFDKADIKEKIIEAKTKADLVIVAPHWGKEYVSVPEVSPGVAPDNPREIAHLMIDSGADLIIGNHPHWVQGLEMYKGRLITYALGNFIFDQMWSQETREGVVGKYIFYANKLIDVRFYPVLIEDYSQPRLLSEKEGSVILERMAEASEKIVSQN
jgi:poly-gamma-glutamate synthesis protein (capsule biosynthesis protein)